MNTRHAQFAGCFTLSLACMCQHQPAEETLLSTLEAPTPDLRMAVDFLMHRPPAEASELIFKTMTLAGNRELLAALSPLLEASNVAVRAESASAWKSIDGLRTRALVHPVFELKRPPDELDLSRSAGAWSVAFQRVSVAPSCVTTRDLRWTNSGINGSTFNARGKSGESLEQSPQTSAHPLQFPTWTIHELHLGDVLVDSLLILVTDDPYAKHADDREERQKRISILTDDTRTYWTVELPVLVTAHLSTPIFQEVDWDRLMQQQSHAINSDAFGAFENRVVYFHFLIESPTECRLLSDTEALEWAKPQLP